MLRYASHAITSCGPSEVVLEPGRASPETKGAIGFGDVKREDMQLGGFSQRYTRITDALLLLAMQAGLLGRSY